jgi:hypothetical protein
MDSEHEFTDCNDGDPVDGEGRGDEPNDGRDPDSSESIPDESQPTVRSARTSRRRPSVRRSFIDDTLVDSLATGDTQIEAGQLAGVSDRTVRRRLVDDAFVERVQMRRAELLGRAAGRSAALASDAVRVLGELLDCDALSVRLGAARTAIDVARHLVTEDDIIIRLARLEAAAAAEESD